jgi:PAS domain S-box-containing protein
MSEFINNSEIRKEKLLELGIGMIEGRNNPGFVGRFEEEVEHATPRDIVFIVDGMVKTGKPMEELKKAVSKVINLMYLPLQQNQPGNFDHVPFIKAMMDENREMEKRMKAIKFYVKSINIGEIDEAQLTQLKAEMCMKIADLEIFDRHYIRKENILFPWLEKVWQDYRCLHVMWSLHDDARKSIRDLKKTLQMQNMPMDRFNQQVGELFFSVYPLIYRENHILFPVAIDEVPEKAWENMYRQSKEIGYAWIEVSHSEDSNEQPIKETDPAKPGMIDLDTGFLSAGQVVNIFNHLPVDITFVDENDEVRYFSNSKNRHFPRSKAIIGRKVQNCHPPESIDIVNRILDAFRSGEKDEATFWIQMKGRFVQIRYFAVRDEQKHYKGVVEVSQDVTEIRKLEGERRLLDW